MATWNEQLKRIDMLRLQRQANDDKLYAAQLAMQRIDNKLKKIDDRETGTVIESVAIRQLREKIVTLQQTLAGINKELTGIDRFLASVKIMDQQISFLEKKIQVLNEEIADINDQLSRMRREPRINRQKIKELEEKLAVLQKLLLSLIKDIERSRRERSQINQQELEAKQKKDELERKRKEVSAQLAQQEKDLKDLLNSSPGSRDEAAGEKERLNQEIKNSKAALETSRLHLHEAITGIYANPHPRTSIKNLDDKIPFLLMPVRIETRFATGTSPELWLRIYPDDIVVHTHEKLLTETEVTEGEKYWKALFEAEKKSGDEKEDGKKQAWNEITKTFGPQRSAWVASQTKPLNWTTIETLSDVSQLNLTAHDTTKLSAWTRAPRAFELPDKFVVMLYEGETIVKEVIGATVPDELFLGPEPMEPDESFVMKDDMLGFGESFNWTSDFDKAIEKGMGFRIPLTALQASKGFDKILVLGVALSIDAPQGQKNIEALIDNHHYSTKGFSIVPQGTPTNNTDAQASGYKSNDPFNNTSYFVEAGDELFGPSTDCDGRNLAHALGIKYAPLQFVEHSDAKDLKEAVAMNTALYPSTLGYYFNTLLTPVLTETAQRQLREFFIPHVTGRGALPAIRVGDQPYGILLTSDYSNWKWSANETGADHSFFTGLQNVMDHYTRLWNNLALQAKYMGKPGTDPSEVMMDILGLHSGSVMFNQRVAYTSDDLKNRAAMQGTEKYAAHLQKNFDSKTNVMAFFAGFGYDLLDENDNPRVPQLLRLVYQYLPTALVPSDLIDDRPLSEKDPIHFYDTVAEKNYIHWLRETESVEVLRQRDFGDVPAPVNLLFLQLLRSLLLELHATSNDWLKNKGIDFSSTRAVANFHNIRKADITKWEVMKGKVGIAVPSHVRKDMAVADFVLTDGAIETEAAFLNRMKNAFDILAKLPTARLERCLTEHIDTCSYRLDAWQSAFFRKRLALQRKVSSFNADSGEQNRRMGIYLGAFGWVEDVRPSMKRRITDREHVPGDLTTNMQPLFEYADNGGFVHTPSLNHAIAAAVLRSGYLNHANSSQPGLLSVNLSSQRVREALFIIDGIRNGQSLEALLGYQFERGLHDKGSLSDDMKLLNAYIYDFRNAFPLERHIVLQQGATTTTETVPATDVVNGLRLAEKEGNFPWGATGEVMSASDDLKKAVIEEKERLSATLDAVKDLMLSEAVFQLTQGNYDRGAAVMNCMKESSVPPDIDIHKTPRSSQFTFTNRVTVQFEDIAPADAANPRCIMEPGMNDWLQTVLGNMDQLAYKVSQSDDESVAEDMTVQQLGLQSIDLVYIAGDELNTGSNEENNTAASELETRIAHAFRVLKGLDDDVSVKISFFNLEDSTGKKKLGELLPLLRMLKSLITNSRSLHAQDFLPASSDLSTDTVNLKRYEPGELAGRISRLMELFDGYLAELENVSIQLTEPVETLNGIVTLGDLFSLLRTKGREFSGIAYTLNNSDVTTLLRTLTFVSGFGLADSFPQVSSAFTDGKKQLLLVQVFNVTRKMNEIKTGVANIITDEETITDAEKKTEMLVKAGKLLLGDVFNILPVFTYANSTDIQRSSDDRYQLLKYAKEQLRMTFVADEWMQNIAHVRPRLGVWENVRMFAEMFNGGSLSLKPVQLPFRANDSWVALEFPAERKPGVPFMIDHDTLSITIHGEGAFNTASRQKGLMIDEVVEMIPGKDEITGITFNYNQPNAMPPQALLLAITPEEKGNWDWDVLIGILNDTLLRAKQRAVDPDILSKSTRSEIGVLLPAILANFAEDDLDLVLDYRTTVAFYSENSPVNIVNV